MEVTCSSCDLGRNRVCDPRGGRYPRAKGAGNVIESRKKVNQILIGHFYRLCHRSELGKNVNTDEAAALG